MDGETALIRDIYAAALDERPWQDVIDRTVKLFDATGAFLFTTFMSEAQGGLAVFNGLPDREARQFLAEVATVDVWCHTLLRRFGELRTGLRWQTDALVPEKELRRTRFFADYLRPCEVGRGLGVMIGDGSSGWAPQMPLCLYRPHRSQAFTAADEARLAGLQVHFTQAMEIRQRLRTATQAEAALAIERVSGAVVVLARDRTILLANPAAEAIFSDGGLPLVKGGRLCAGEPAHQSMLDKALERCATYRFDDRLSMSMRLGGPPGQGVVARLAPPPKSLPKGNRAAAIAFLSREGRSAVDLPALAVQLYKLTPAEAALVKALSEGLTPEAFADERHVAVATVKTQLRSVFAKTGARRQSDLMRLLFSIAR